MKLGDSTAMKVETGITGAEEVSEEDEGDMDEIVAGLARADGMREKLLDEDSDGGCEEEVTKGKQREVENKGEGHGNGNGSDSGLASDPGIVFQNIKSQIKLSCRSVGGRVIMG